ncbi:MAG: hypothetical protein AAFQ63_00825 [Cyanobacteria bacterium J06621_11]
MSKLFMKKSFLFVGLLALLIACSAPNRDAIEASLAWARMSALPESAQQIETVIQGSMFTREFEVSFQAEKEDIQYWLANSEGTKTATVSTSGDTSVYKVVPGEGAQFARVYVDWATLTVLIQTHWS